MKAQRQQAILELIRQQAIDTQDGLARALAEMGLQVTQATVSRDIRELRLVKEVSSDGKYRYTQAGADEDSDAARRRMEIFREGCVSFDHALHTVVVKTMPGLASAVCGAIDAPGEVSLEERMGCGFGICYGCSCHTADGPRRICADGPVFKKEDLIWQSK